MSKGAPPPKNPGVPTLLPCDVKAFRAFQVGFGRSDFREAQTATGKDCLAMPGTSMHMKHATACFRRDDSTQR